MHPPLDLTDDQVAFYRNNGYLALPSLMPANEVARVRAVYDRLFAERTGREIGDQFDLAGTDEEGKEARLPQILGPSRFAPELLQGRSLPSVSRRSYDPPLSHGALHGP